MPSFAANTINLPEGNFSLELFYRGARIPECDQLNLTVAVDLIAPKNEGKYRFYVLILFFT